MNNLIPRLSQQNRMGEPGIFLDIHVIRRS